MKRSCLIAFILGIVAAFIDLLSIGPLLTLKRPVIRWIVSWPAPNFAAWLNLYSLYLVPLLLVLLAAIVIRRRNIHRPVIVFLSFAAGLHLMDWFWTVNQAVRGYGGSWAIELWTLSYDLVIIGAGLIVLLAFRRPPTVRGFEPVMETESPDRISSSPEP